MVNVPVRDTHWHHRETSHLEFQEIRWESGPGSSLEFIDHREYQPGDDLRRIDWGGFARSDKLTVKLYRDEVSPHLDIVIDGSCSMSLENSPKTQATLGLAAVFATAASNVGFSHAAWMAGDGFRQVENGTNRASIWEGIDFGYRGDLLTSFTRLPPTWRPYGLRVLLSDLLFPGDPLATMSRFAERATAIVVVQVLAESDANPMERGNIRLVDSETDEVQEVFVDAGAENRYRGGTCPTSGKLASCDKASRRGYDHCRRRAHSCRLAA